MAHDVESWKTMRHNHHHQDVLFQTRKDWELHNLSRRRELVRSVSRCMRRAWSTKALNRCERRFDRGLHELRRERKQALKRESKIRLASWRDD